MKKISAHIVSLLLAVVLIVTAAFSAPVSLFVGNVKAVAATSTQVSACSGLKVKSQTNTSITLIWNKANGATGYILYRYNPTQKSYTALKNTNANSFTVHNLTAGATYYFKVKPYAKSANGKTIWGTASSMLKTATKPATPTLKVTSPSKGKITVSWNNIAGESGYQVYYSTSKNGTYKKLKSLSANATSCSSTGFTAGKTYYFKVRAYKTVDDTVIYGSFSAVKAVTVKGSSSSSGNTSTTKATNNTTYYITETGEKYHVGSCRTLKKSKIPISYKDAVARGYGPCGICIK
ncbi:MAG: fibronectin type III domain-containing protein [Ruminococcus sp.]